MEIEENAFSGCSSLTTVEYDGNEDEWYEVYIGLGNDYLENADIHFNCSLTEFIPLTEATVQKNGSSISIALEKAYSYSTAYAAYYDTDGKLISVGTAMPDIDGNASVYIANGSASAKVFVWLNNMQPLTVPTEIEL